MAAEAAAIAAGARRHTAAPARARLGICSAAKGRAAVARAAARPCAAGRAAVRRAATGRFTLGRSAAAAAGSGAAAAVDDGATKSTYARGSGGSGVSGGSGGSSGRGKYSLDGLLEHLTDFIEERDNHLNDLLSYYARRIGLSNGATARTPCYTLSDDLLRHLVLATLDKNEPFLMLREFLERVYERYHLVIGPIEGRLYYQERSSKSAEYTDEIEFTKNHRALRAKLERLGLLIPLSDSCDYIKNPYATGNSH